MQSINPYLTQISDQLALTWQSEKRKHDEYEIANLTKSNRLQISLANRLAATTGIIELKLIDQEQLVGKVIGVGSDAVLLQTAVSNELIPLSAISVVTGIGKGRQISEVVRKIQYSMLFQLLEREISIFGTGYQIYSGKLINVWQDSIDMSISENLLTFKLSNVVRISFGVI